MQFHILGILRTPAGRNFPFKKIKGSYIPLIIKTELKIKINFLKEYLDIDIHVSVNMKGVVPERDKRHLKNKCVQLN